MTDQANQNAIAISGVGIITPLGDSLPALAEALVAGRSCIESDTTSGRALSRLHDFDARRYVNVRGMRVYGRATQLQIAATQLALDDAQRDASAIERGAPLGVVCGATFAHLETLLEYDHDLVTTGPSRTNPTLMPLALASTAGALTALSFDAKAFAITLSDGGGSGLSALALAARMLHQGRARACIVTAAFTDCAELSTAAERAGMLTSAEDFRVFDLNSRGTVFGELAVALLLERPADARARGRTPLGYVRGEGAGFASDPMTSDRTLARAIRDALRTGQCEPRDLALVSASASGISRSDVAEARALREALSDALSTTVVTAPKASLGESLDASGLVQAVSALAALRSHVAAPILQLREPAVSGLRYALTPTEVAGESALLTSITPAGACSALLLSVQP